MMPVVLLFLVCRCGSVDIRLELVCVIRIEDFTLRNVPARVAALGDLWKPLLASRGRFNLSQYI